MSLAAALSDMRVEYVDGVTEVADKALPPGGSNLHMNAGNIGSWRAHVNALRQVVEQNLTTALILEDDVDWDIRIKSQMRDFAKASRLLIQPLKGSTDRFLDSTFPRPGEGAHNAENFDVKQKNGAVEEPMSSPYGDINRWDMLWIGHCGVRFPWASDGNVPIGRAVISNDETVPEPQHIEMQFGDTELQDQYPAHTRVVSRARVGTCIIGYAVSQPGARRLLYELGVNKMDASTDIMMRNICDGQGDRETATCFTVQPQLFQHHRPIAEKGSFSDITDHGHAYNKKAYTRNVRWSTHLNFQNLLGGRTDYIDLFKDGEEKDPDLGFG